MPFWYGCGIRQRRGDKGMMVLKGGGIEDIPISRNDERFITILSIAEILG
jgi:hypothetical protein